MGPSVPLLALDLQGAKLFNLVLARQSTFAIAMVLVRQIPISLSISAAVSMVLDLDSMPIATAVITT